MPLGIPRLESYHDFAQSELSRDIQRRIWREQPDFWGEVIPAAFTLENTVGALRERMKFPLSGTPPNPDFSPFQPELIEGTVFEDHPEFLIEARNMEDYRIIKSRVENEMQNLQIVMDSGGLALGAMLLAGGFDLVNLLPIGGATVARTSSILRAPFREAARRVKRGARAGFMGNTYAEVGLHAVEDFRTPEQAALNISAGTLFGAMVGTVAAIPAGLRAKALRDLEADFGQPPPRGPRPIEDAPEMPIAKVDTRGTRRAESDELFLIDRQEIENGTKPISPATVGASRNGAIVNIRRPMWGLTRGEVASHPVRNFQWAPRSLLESKRGSEASTTSMIYWSELKRLLPPIRAKLIDAPEPTFSRPAVLVEVKNPNRPTPHVAAEMEIRAFTGEEGLAHVAALAERHGIDPEIPVQIHVPDLPQKDVTDAISIGRLRAHMAAKTPAQHRLTRSITCASPCKITTNEEIIARGETIPGGYHEDGTIGVSKAAQDFDTTGAYNPDVEATKAEMVSALGVEKLIGKWFPAVRLATNPNQMIRQVAPKLIDTTLRMEQFAEGQIQSRSAESGIRKMNASLGKTIALYRDLYLAHIRSLTDKKAMRSPNLEATLVSAKNIFKGPPEGGYTERQFLEEVGRAVRNMLNDEPGHPDKHVAAAAAYTRDLIRAFTDAAEEVGIMGRIDRTDAQGNPTTVVTSNKGRALSNSYFTRVYKKQLLRRPEERALFIRTAIESWTRYYGPDEFNVYHEGAVEAYNNIMGTPAGRTPPAHIKLFSETFHKPDIDQNRQPGATRPRTLDLTDAELGRWLEDDARLVVRFLFRTLVPDIEIARNFGRLVEAEDGTKQWVGDPNMTATLRMLNKNIDRQVDIMSALGHKSENIKRYQRLARQGVVDLANLRDLLRGQYAVPSNPDHWSYVGLRSFRQLNYWGMGGGFMSSSIPDIGRLVTVNGMEHVYRTHLDYLSLPKEVKKIVGQETRLAGVGMETVLNKRGQNVFDLGDDYARMSRIELGMRSVSDKFAFISLLSPWNDTMKHFAGIYNSQLMARYLTDWVEGKATRKQIEHISFWGFNFGVAKKIVKELEGRERYKSLIVLDTQNWKSREARDAFQLALGRNVDRTIITPMAGDVPMLINTEIGRSVGQFKRFALAATKQILLSGLQWRDKNAMNGAILMVAMGMFVAQLKAEQYGYGIGDTRELLLQGVDRSGLLGAIPDINKSLGQASRGALAPGQLIFGGHNRYKYSEQDLSDVLMGPTRGTLRTMGKAATGFKKLATGESSEIRESEIRSAVKLSTPYTLFYLTNTLENMIVKPVNRHFLRQRREAKEARQAEYERRNGNRRLDPRIQSERTLNRGNYTFMEMEFEDNGVDGMLDFLEERHEILSGDQLRIAPEIRQKLRKRFSESNLASLKRASDEGGTAGMLEYLTNHARGTA